MKDLSLHILDIVENSVAASASKIEIRISEDKKKDFFTPPKRFAGLVLACLYYQRQPKQQMVTFP
jgi:hypothetical protein